MRVLRVSVGTEQFKFFWRVLYEPLNGELAELVRALFSMKDARARFQTLRLSTVSRLSHLFCTISPSITHEASTAYDVLVEWALASVVSGNGAAAAGLPTTEEATHDPRVYKK